MQILFRYENLLIKFVEFDKSENYQIVIGF